jgi:hypothetical protein
MFVHQDLKHDGRVIALVRVEVVVPRVGGEERYPLAQHVREIAYRELAEDPGEAVDQLQVRSA